MPKNIPSLKPRQLIRMLEKGGCSFYREGKGDHSIYIRALDGKMRVARKKWGQACNIAALDLVV
jgi:predicted RNA binding protein YcfA (HicA-like mRNA interferase family)